MEHSGEGRAVSVAWIVVGIEFLNALPVRSRIILVACALAAACGAVLPGHFWEGFRSDCLVDCDSDRGGWGGHLTLHWQVVDEGPLERDVVVRYAESNDWKLSKEVHLSTRELAQWDWLGTRYFPLSRHGYEEFSRVPHGTRLIFNDARFPVRVSTDATLLIFETDVVLFAEIGTDGSTENGFILIADDGKAMSLYHVWGE